MKRMIISPAQLKAINEAASLMYSAPSSNVQSVAQAAMAKHPGQEVTIDVTDNTPGTNGTLGFSDTTANTDPSQIKNFDKMTFGSNNTGATGSALEETRYSKRQVELGRMLEMRRTGKVYSKKQLNEMFMETQDNVNRLDAGLGNCLIFKIFNAVATVFGPEVEEEMKERISNGEDPMMTIKDIFSREESEKQEEFLNTLGI